MRDILLEIIQKKAPQLGLNGLPELYQMVMHDAKPRFTHGIYLFIEHENNEESSFKAAIELIDKNAAAEIFFVHHGKWAGSPGYGHWQEKLGKFTGPGRIRPIKMDDIFGVNTLSESIALVRFAYEEKRKSFYLVAPPFHMLRAFMTAASVAIRHGSEINFFAYPGALQDLNQAVRHSQGKGPFPRWKWFELELETISNHSEKNNIPLPSGIIKYESIPTIIDYMQKRELKF